MLLVLILILDEWFLILPSPFVILPKKAKQKVGFPAFLLGDLPESTSSPTFPFYEEIPVEALWPVLELSTLYLFFGHPQANPF